MATRRLIHIPKVADDQLYEFAIMRGEIVETYRAMKVKLQKTEFMGVEIPRGYEVWIPGGHLASIKNGFSMHPHVYIQGWKLS